MIEQIIYIDKIIFIFINQSLSNDILDFMLPSITDWDKTIFGRLVAGVIVIGLLWKGGKNGRTVVIMLIPTIIISDQLSSSIIKPWISRPRPCHEVGGIMLIENLRLLVNCGSGFSFPSSHAVNNFAAASMLTIFYKRYWWLLGSFAFLVAFSRVYVGVHYPIDIAAGAILGILCTIFVYQIWIIFSKKIIKYETK